MKEPLFLKGVFKEKIWGGSKLESQYDYAIPSSKTGELWAISAHENGPSTVMNGEFQGKTLNELWQSSPELFGNPDENVFPLLTKIIDAEDDLSVQVHPDDDYGLEKEGELGKTECWYILAADEGSEIIYGHHAQTTDELEEMITQGDWDNLLRRIPVKAGDFFYVPSGTIHAIGSGIMILETQQSSDTTYRVYDYDRVQDDGDLRDLHIIDSLAVTTVPHFDPQPNQTIKKSGQSTITTLVSNDFFTVQKWTVNGSTPFNAEGDYTLVSVLEGNGELTIENSSYTLNQGIHFIIPYGIDSWTIDGNLTTISSVSGK